MSKELHSIKVIKVSEMYCASFGQMRGGKEDGEGKGGGRCMCMGNCVFSACFQN